MRGKQTIVQGKYKLIGKHFTKTQNIRAIKEKKQTGS